MTIGNEGELEKLKAAGRAVGRTEGEFKPGVDREYPLSEWREAFETLAQRKVVGKTIIRPDL